MWSFAHASITQRIVKSGHHMDCSGLVVLPRYAHCAEEVGSGDSDGATLHMMLLFSLQSCMQGGGREGMGQVRNTNRQCRKVNEDLQ